MVFKIRQNDDGRIYPEGQNQVSYRYPQPKTKPTNNYPVPHKTKCRKSCSIHMEPTANLDMERYIFDIATDDGIKEATVESSGECYSVKLDDRFLGTMWQDQNRGMQWKTEDQPLEEYLWDISAALSQVFSRNGFPTLLKGAYPEIIQTAWKSSETLEVTINPDTDLEVFSTFLKDEVSNLADFEEHLDLIVKKQGDDYFKIIGVN